MIANGATRAVDTAARVDFHIGLVSGLRRDQAGTGTSRLERDQTSERRKNDQDLDDADFPHLGTSFESFKTSVAAAQ
jgi:hypothetical protein